MKKTCCSMSENNTFIWLWSEPDSKWKNEVLNYIKSVEPLHKDIVVLHCEDVKGFDESLPLNNYLLNVGLEYDLFEDHRAVFLNSKDLITAIELCLVQERKQSGSLETEIKDEEILQCYKAYQDHFVTEDTELTKKTILHLKTFIKDSNSIDLCLLYDAFAKCSNMLRVKDHIADYKFLILGTPQSYIFKKALYLISGNDELQSIVVEIPRNIDHQDNLHLLPSQFKVTADPLKLEGIVHNAKKTELGSATEEFVEDVIIAFLSLLVNSRNELALSKAMISPIVDLSREAFTELKHLAAEKNMPMCQVAISYVTRVRLGGKGYAPPADCPMLPHLKGLELFVDILNQMQTIIEEDVVPKSAIKKLINSLKKKLLKSRGSFKADAIETVANNLISTFLIASSATKTKRETNTTPQICQETLDALYSFINYINCNYWTFDPERILEKKQSKRTPLNLPPLLGYFRTPEEESSCDTQTTLNEDSNISKTSVDPTTVSYFHNSESSMSVSCVESTTPSKTNFKDCFDSEKMKAKENFSVQLKSSGKAKENPFSVSKNRKRSILSEITNENKINKRKTENDTYKIEEKKPKNTLVESKKSSKVLRKEPKKVPKKLKLIPGQGKITSFFK